MVKFSVAITTVPGRASLMRRCVDLLNIHMPSTSILISSDPTFRGTWFNLRQAVLMLLRDGSKYSIIIQDDCYPCSNFGNLVSSLVDVLPDEVIELYAGWSCKSFIDSARRKNKNLYKFKHGLTGQGLIIPTSKLEDFILWTNRHLDPTIKKNCDTVVMSWVNTDSDRWVWQTVPELIAHNDHNLSTIGNHSVHKSMGAYYFSDGSPIDWAASLQNTPEYPRSYEYEEKWKALHLH